MFEEEIERADTLPAQDGPTFEDLAIDDTLTDLERICKYGRSAIALQRLVHVKMIAETAKVVGAEVAIESLIPLMEELMGDTEFVVRQHLVAQFPDICKLMQENGHYERVVETLLPLVAKMVNDTHNDVREASRSAFVEIAKLIPQDDQILYVLMLVLPMAHEDDNEEMRIAAVMLLSDLVEALGVDLCHQFVVPDMISLSEDTIFRVRKATAAQIGIICKVVEPEVVMDRLLPAYLNLTEDDIWGVRKACAESLVAVSQSLDKNERGIQLIPIFQSFIEDSSKWVRMAAFQNLGPFISTLKPSSVPQSLITAFNSMGMNEEPATSVTKLGSTGGDEAAADLAYYCAYSFPAVAEALGSERWEELSYTYGILSGHESPKVRRTLAFSIHEIAKIIGFEKTEADLLYTFDVFLRDDAEDVKLGVIQHLPGFLRAVAGESRKGYLPLLTSLGAETGHNWRLRGMLAQKLGELCALYDPNEVMDRIFPLAITFAKDEISSVREDSVHSFPTLFSRIEGFNVEWLKKMSEETLLLGSSDRFRDRQAFVGICGMFLRKETTSRYFEQFFVQQLFALTQDTVKNVRLPIAQLLADAPEWVFKIAEMEQARIRFTEDLDPEIQSMFSPTTTLPDTLPAPAPIHVST